MKNRLSPTMIDALVRASRFRPAGMSERQWMRHTYARKGTVDALRRRDLAKGAEKIGYDYYRTVLTPEGLRERKRHVPAGYVDGPVQDFARGFSTNATFMGAS